jgi:hypothetical protein
MAGRLVTGHASTLSSADHQGHGDKMIEIIPEVVDTTPLNEEYLLTTEIEITEPGFGRKGRIAYSKTLTASHRAILLEKQTT